MIRILAGNSAGNGREILFLDSLDPGDSFCTLKRPQNSVWGDFEAYSILQKNHFSWNSPKTAEFLNQCKTMLWHHLRDQISILGVSEQFGGKPEKSSFFGQNLAICDFDNFFWRAECAPPKKLFAKVAVQNLAASLIWAFVGVLCDVCVAGRCCSVHMDVGAWHA